MSFKREQQWSKQKRKEALRRKQTEGTKAWKLGGSKSCEIVESRRQGKEEERGQL